MSSYFLGVDLGTSSLKTILLDAESGSLLAQVAAEYSIQTPQPGWAEQDPQIWVDAFLSTLPVVMSQARIDASQIEGISFSGQMHGCVCLDAQGNPLRPAIIWADQRSARQVEQVYTCQGIEKLGAATGNPLAAGFMLPTLLWLRENEAEVYTRIHQVMLPKDYLRLVITGEYGSEPSDASSTGLFDPARQDWNEDWLTGLAIPLRFLPPVKPSHAPGGSVSKPFAILSGLRAGTPVFMGASDQSAQALGNGIIQPGDVSCTIGTGGQILAPVLQPRYDPQLRLHLFCHALPQVWHLESATLSAGLSLKWLRDHFFEDRSYQQLVDEAAHAPVGAEGLRYLPYLAGERTPIMDPLATGSFTGLTLRHHRRHLVRAVLEGVVFSLRQGLDLMQTLGAPIQRIVASGGGTRHPLWLQLQADIFARPIYQSSTPEAAALGAALLAAVGSGYYASFEQACQHIVHWKPAAIEPIENNVRLYEEIYPHYCSLYPTLRATFNRKSGNE
ncbi:hypothetical protein ADN00_16230 [Ornatilinea apprima]|uniref:Xylulose kinase n=1 Tax=Ornatilinea apprima TaxID=1134406 RepID=A0A0P6WSQ8_9CHLR|nr:xylulokinase [Ornatilinea apprima]KPL72032.1 hypothetical protein ADN00_16230 [Ornatilinea apprima]